MKNLIEGILDFRKRILPHCRDKFAELAKGQNPDVLFITCSDSRVAPNWFASTNPGELFVVRNVGNLVPPASKKQSENIDTSAIAAAEFAVLQLNVCHIVVCGHSDCGAMNAIANNSSIEGASHLDAWLEYAKPVLKKQSAGFSPDPSLSVVNQISQKNVLLQMEHLKSHPFIKKQIEAGKLQIHGWWFDIAKADVYSFNKTTKQFQVIE